MSLTMTDLFCGGGGSSTGAIQVPGVEIKIAANHWDLAVAVHNRNHPDADHAAVDLHEEDPRYFPRTDILWASPECTKWSQASGGKYANIGIDGGLLDLLDPELVEEDPETAIVQRSRLLMFDVLRFAEHHRYAAMVVENVVDVATNAKFAEAWALWKKSLTNLGYAYRVVSLNSMHAQAHGDPAPQSRDRLYVVCWLRGNRAPDVDKVMRPLAWCPACSEVVESQQVWKAGRTVGKYRSQYVYLHGACGTAVEPGYLPAAAAIDWTLQGTRIGDRPKPLADKTRRRIAAGIARYWSPFHMESGGNQYDAADPKHASFGDPNGYYRAWSMLDTLKTLHTQETKALCVPAGGTWNDDARPTSEPHRTMTTRETTALVAPLEGRAGDRVNHAGQPLRTQTSRHLDALVTPPFIAELRGGGSTARPVGQPAATFTASGNHHGLVQPPADRVPRCWASGRPESPTCGEPTRADIFNGVYCACERGQAGVDHRTGGLLTSYYGRGGAGSTTGEPMPTVTTVDRHALIQRHNTSKGEGAEMLTPAAEYLRTLTTTAQQSVITPGGIAAAEAQVDDCLFRMLEPHEVARGMAFPADYLWEGTRRQRVKLAGNAVTPPAARDLIAAVAESLGAA